jgi:hypothetical protein
MLGSSDFDQNVMSLGRGAYFFRREWGEPFFGGDGKNIWREPVVKIIFLGGEEALSPQPPHKIRRERNLHSTLHILLGNYIQVSKIIPRKLCFVIRIFLFQLMQII